MKALPAFDPDHVYNHDEVADIVMQTVVGISSGVTREDLLHKMREKYPTLDELNAFLRQANEHYEAYAAARRNGGHPPNRTHN